MQILDTPSPALSSITPSQLLAWMSNVGFPGRQKNKCSLQEVDSYEALLMPYEYLHRITYNTVYCWAPCINLTAAAKASKSQ